MTKLQKSIIFIILVSLFVITVPTIILYVQGYRLDLEKKKIVQTGAISITAWPKSAQVWVDGKFKGTTGFLSRNIFLQNIIPGFHKVVVKKDGYYSWEKDLEVKEKLVTEAHNVILFPKRLSWDNIASNVKMYWLSPQENFLLLFVVNESNQPQLKIINIENKTSSILKFKKPIILSATSTAIWSKDETRVILKPNNLIIDLKDKQVLAFSWPDPIKDIKFNVLDKNIILILSSKVNSTQNETSQDILWQHDLSQGTKLPILQKVLAFDVSPNGIIWLSDKGYIYQSDFSGTITKVLNTAPHKINLKAKYNLYAFNPKGILITEDANLFFLNPKTQALERINQNIKQLKLSQDLNKIAFSTAHEIWVMYFYPRTRQPLKKAGEYNLLSRFSSEIKEISWLGLNHLAINFGNTIKIIEIDDRDKVNIEELNLPVSNTDNPKISFGQLSKKIYFLSKQKLFTSAKLLP